MSKKHIRKRNHGNKISTLMSRMTSRHGIHFKDVNKAKRTLLLMGYFHGYKGCRFVVRQRVKYTHRHQHITLVRNNLRLHHFYQIRDIYKINNRLRIFFYSILTQVCTALKNYTSYVVTNRGGIYLNDIFKNCINNYKYPINDKHLRDSFKLRSRIENSISYSQPYGDIMIRHYRKNSEDIPLWAVFELISLGTFGDFLGCLQEPFRKDIERILNMTDSKNDSSYNLLSKHVYILVNLRNAIAHNKIIFDSRFRGKKGIKPSVKRDLEIKSHVSSIEFTSIVDYFILLAYYQYLFKVDPVKIKREKHKLKGILNTFKCEFGYSRFYKTFEGKPLTKLKKMYFKN